MAFLYVLSRNVGIIVCFVQKCWHFCMFWIEMFGLLYVLYRDDGILIFYTEMMAFLYFM